MKAFEPFMLMFNRVKKLWVCCVATLLSVTCFSQNQACPVNINFSTGDLSFWSATTGLVNAVPRSYPAPNTGVFSIPEFTISPAGIQVLTTNSFDLYGNFPVIPTINGY